MRTAVVALILVGLAVLLFLLDDSEPLRMDCRSSSRTSVSAWARHLCSTRSATSPFTRNGAMLFFQLINRGYEQASTVSTNNRDSRSGAFAGFSLALIFGVSCGYLRPRLIKSNKGIQRSWSADC